MITVRWWAGAAMLACVGTLLGCGDGDDLVPGATAGTPTPSAAAPSSPALSSPAPTRPAAPADPLLSGEREISMVRVRGSGSELELSGSLVEGGDTGGRVLFVPVPIGDDRYVIRAYGTADGHPANDDPSCWQVNGLDIEPELTIQASTCDADDPIQRFTIIAQGDGTYVIGSESRTLQHMPGNGLVLKERGDAPPPTTFRLVDKGPFKREPLN
ncbi:hypothetical protein ACIA3K_27645 [Micromonospora sp. NPDC051543]|uniref:hypothetical protein n=1 Tax=Micromonospora sp. NPDC051543 TaxID=3364287 RepID=UPI00378B9238